MDSVSEGVSGGVGGSTVGSVIVICRRTLTEIVASVAISAAKIWLRGVVVKTTKKGTVEFLENVMVDGNVT